MGTDGRMRVVGLDHVVLLVEDPGASAEWYRRHLGLEVLRLDEWRRGEVPFPSLRVDATTVIDLLAGRVDGRNVDHLALVVDGVDLDELAVDPGLEVVAGPADLWGAQGRGRGLYISDPDGHVVELRTYG